MKQLFVIFIGLALFSFGSDAWWASHEAQSIPQTVVGLALMTASVVWFGWFIDKGIR